MLGPPYTLVGPTAIGGGGQILGIVHGALIYRVTGHQCVQTSIEIAPSSTVKAKSYKTISVSRPGARSAMKRQVIQHDCEKRIPPINLPEGGVRGVRAPAS